MYKNKKENNLIYYNTGLNCPSCDSSLDCIAYFKEEKDYYLLCGNCNYYERAAEILNENNLENIIKTTKDNYYSKKRRKTKESSNKLFKQHSLYKLI